MGPLPLVAGLIALAAALLASVQDLARFRIPNWLTLPLLVSGLLYHGIAGERGALLGSTLGVLFGGGILLLLHLRGGVGGGDVKLMAAVGAWLGVPWTVYAFVGFGLAAGAYALALLAWQGPAALRGSVLRPVPEGERIEQQVKQPDRRRLIPFAPLIAVGVLTALVWSFLGAGG